jgi:hypothetical protein
MAMKPCESRSEASPERPTPSETPQKAAVIAPGNLNAGDNEQNNKCVILGGEKDDLLTEFW